MSQTERRHERLAVRLSLIISRLVAGETLDMGLLAAEFGVSLRTLRRDFRERLMYPHYQPPCCWRNTGYGPSCRRVWCIAPYPPPGFS